MASPTLQNAELSPITFTTYMSKMDMAEVSTFTILERNKLCMSLTTGLTMSITPKVYEREKERELVDQFEQPRVSSQ